MKVTIDTKEDSPEEIKNAIKILSSLVGEKPRTNQPNIFEDTSPEVNTSQSMPTQGNIFGNMFNDPKTEEPDDEVKEETKTEIKDEPYISEYY
ncbi:hypothetical protein ISS05_00165 [Candidatus Woesearchaeota archaeon]|nr:hypothetical protein [Candidatus Woesearchaeota archaeon]